MSGALRENLVNFRHSFGSEISVGLPFAACWAVGEGTLDISLRASPDFPSFLVFKLGHRALASHFSSPLTEDRIAGPEVGVSWIHTGGTENMKFMSLRPSSLLAFWRKRSGESRSSPFKMGLDSQEWASYPLLGIFPFLGLDLSLKNWPALSLLSIRPSNELSLNNGMAGGGPTNSQPKPSFS